MSSRPGSFASSRLTSSPGEVSTRGVRHEREDADREGDQRRPEGRARGR
jgi:hypothetical protein